jgi:hypothetical protein
MGHDPSILGALASYVVGHYKVGRVSAKGSGASRVLKRETHQFDVRIDHGVSAWSQIVRSEAPARGRCCLASLLSALESNNRLYGVRGRS